MKISVLLIPTLMWIKFTQILRNYQITLISVHHNYSFHNIDALNDIISDESISKKFFFR